MLCVSERIKTKIKIHSFQYRKNEYLIAILRFSRNKQKAFNTNGIHEKCKATLRQRDLVHIHLILKRNVIEIIIYNLIKKFHFNAYKYIHTYVFDEIAQKGVFNVIVSSHFLGHIGNCNSFLLFSERF